MGRVTLVLVALVVTIASGRTVTSAERPSPPKITAVDTVPAVWMTRGETTNVPVSITVADGYHVQANPASGEFLIPLEVQLDSVAGLAFGKVEYPGGVTHRLEGTDNVLQTYSGNFAVKVSITALKTGAFDVNGRVSYQACDSKRCLFPSYVPFAFKIFVEEKPRKAGG